MRGYRLYDNVASRCWAVEHNEIGEIGVGFPWIHLYNHNFLGSDVKSNNGIDVFSA